MKFSYSIWFERKRPLDNMATDINATEHKKKTG